MKLPFSIDLSGKVAVVTGAGGVLCSDMAKALAQCGAKVALIGRTLEPLQAEYKRLIADKGYLQTVLNENAQTANYLATKTLRKVQKKIGFATR